MKSAKERAQPVAGWAGFPDTVGSAFVELVERAFKEHARDQRHLCAEAVHTADGPSYEPICVLVYAHTAVMNAPEPGKHNG